VEVTQDIAFCGLSCELEVLAFGGRLGGFRSLSRADALFPRKWGFATSASSLRMRKNLR